MLTRRYREGTQRHDHRSLVLAHHDNLAPILGNRQLHPARPAVLESRGLVGWVCAVCSAWLGGLWTGYSGADAIMERAVKTAQERHENYWRAVLRRALSDTSTVDFYDISEGGIDNLALVAARAVVQELAR